MYTHGGRVGIHSVPVKQFPIKLPEGMLARWKEAAARRKTTVAAMVRDAVNRDIEKEEQQKKKRL